MNREILITSKTTSASVDEFLAKVLKAAATSVRSIDSKCFLSVFLHWKIVRVFPLRKCTWFLLFLKRVSCERPRKFIL